MTEKQREQHLKKIAMSPEGVALKSWIEEKMAQLKDASNYSDESFELEGRASVKAAAILKTLMFELGLLKKTNLPKKHNEYM